MLRYLFARRTDWTVFVLACIASLTLMLLGPKSQARAAWFLQHTLLAPAEFVIGWVDRGIATYGENERLRDKVTRLTVQLDQSSAEQAENDRLRRLLHLTGQHPYELFAANVVGRSLDRLGGSLVLDKGQMDGVTANRAILTPDGLVGRVERTTRHGARVLTLLHRDCAVAARIQRSRVDGVVRWEFGDRAALDLLYVSSQEDVLKGDMVVTSGLGGIFPAGVRIGTVEKVGLEPNGLTKEIVIRPAVDFRTLEEVLVYIPAGKNASLPGDFYPAEVTDSTRADSLTAVGDQTAAVKPSIMKSPPAKPPGTKPSQAAKTSPPETMWSTPKTSAAPETSSAGEHVGEGTP
jgi:rod shape-determining protein MreC